MCAESRVDNVELFLSLLSNAWTAFKAFSALAVSGLGKHQKLGGDTAEIADPN